MALFQFTYPACLLGLLLLPVLYALCRRSRASGPASGGGPPSSLLLVRLLSIGLLVVSASGPRLARQGQGPALVFVVDHSASVAAPERATALAYVNQAAAALPRGATAGLVVFGREAAVERALGEPFALSAVQSTPAGTRTDIAQALRLALVMLAPRRHGNIVLLSDGNQNAGDALREALLAAALGITIDTVPLGNTGDPAPPEVSLAEVLAPPQVRLGEAFDVTVVLQGDSQTRVGITVYHHGVSVARQTVSLRRQGRHLFHFPQRLTSPGFHRYTVVVEGLETTTVAEAEGGAVVHAFGKPMLLYVVEEPGAQPLIDVLSLHDFEVVALPPPVVPAAVSALLPYDAVILDNVPARAFTARQLAALADYVEQLGGGLVMTGGVRSFGPGGYDQTPVERVLPVAMRVRQRQQMPQLGVVLVLDKSGSMAAKQVGRTKIEVAKEAVLSLREVLGPDDAMGIIAFDRQARVLLPLRPLAAQGPVGEAMQPVEAHGGTAIFPALDLAYQWLRHASVQRKHVLLLSDGRTEPAAFQSLVGELVAAGVVLSVVGIGADVDQDLLTELASLGRGRAYFTAELADLPSIFTQEGILLAGRWLVEQRFKPRLVGMHDLVRGIEVATFPELGGYIVSTPKPQASVVLISDHQDPILAGWQYGLGKGVVLTTDLQSVWTAELRAWHAFPTLWSQMLRWTARRLPSDLLHPQVAVEGDTVTVRIDAFGADGRFLDFLTLRAVSYAPDSRRQEIPLTQTAAGRYEGRFRAEERGPYLFTVTAAEAQGGGEHELRFGLYLPLFSEQRARRPLLSLLNEIARTTGGRLRSPDEPPSWPTAGMGYLDVWRYPALTALLLFLVDVWRRRGIGGATTGTVIRDA